MTPRQLYGLYIDAYSPVGVEYVPDVDGAYMIDVDDDPKALEEVGRQHAPLGGWGIWALAPETEEFYVTALGYGTGYDATLATRPYVRDFVTGQAPPT